jgi:hypothetical protein
MALVRVAPSTWDNYKLVTYPSPDDIVGMRRFLLRIRYSGFTEVKVLADFRCV